MKKLLVFILAILVIAGSAVPCCLTDDCENDLSHSTSGQQPVEKGACSPFSNCASCSGFVQLAKHINVSAPVTERIPHYEDLIVFIPSSYSPTLIQPPRFS